MSLDTRVDFSGLHRLADGRVAGDVVLAVTGSVAGIPLSFHDSKPFDFPRNGAQEVLNIVVPVNRLSLRVTAKVYERDNQCCVQGHIHVDAPIGGGIGKDLDANCHPIP